MKRIILIFLVGFYSIIAHSQVNYYVQNLPYAHEPYDQGVNINLNLVDDVFFDAMPIGFTFNFFGNNYDSIVISANGSLSFNTSNASNFAFWDLFGISLPNSNKNELFNSILSPYHDIDPSISSVGNSIRINLIGIAPYRKFIATFDSISLYSCNNLLFTSQIILYETSNVVDINIQNKPICPTWNQGSAILGIQNAQGTVAYWPNARNGGQWTATNETWRFIPSNIGPMNPNLCKIKGKIFLESNSNCIQDPNEYGYANNYVFTQQSSYYGLTNNDGEYTMYVDTGTHLVQHIPYTNATVKCPTPAFYQVNFSIPGDSISNINFGDSTEICTDLFSTIAMTGIRYCDYNLVTISYGNFGSLPATNVNLNFDIPLLTNASNFSTPVNQLSNTSFNLNIATLNPGQVSTISFYLNVPCDTSWIGTIKQLSSSISSTSAVLECDTTNNSMFLNQVVVASYDPNIKEAYVSRFAQDGFKTTGYVGSNEWVTYKLNFQNTGSSYAINIKLEDTLDANLLDISTIKFLGASHSSNMIKMNNLISLIFNDINLVDSTTNEVESHGWVLFKIKTKTGLMNGSQILNKAGIYFDNNPVINTNTQIMNIENVSAIKDEIKQKISISPNPSNGLYTVDFFEQKSSVKVKLFDLLGKTILSKEYHNIANIQLDLKDYPNGLYLLELDMDNSVLNYKLMKK